MVDSSIDDAEQLLTPWDFIDRLPQPALMRLLLEALKSDDRLSALATTILVALGPLALEPLVNELTRTRRTRAHRLRMLAIVATVDPGEYILMFARLAVLAGDEDPEVRQAVIAILQRTPVRSV